MRDNYRDVMEEIFRSEGGYADHPSDPGGATNYGITHRTLASWKGRSVTKAEVRKMTKATARAIYRERYWNLVRGNDLDYGFDLVAMDGAVNSGPRRGAEWLQRGLGVTVDGKVGSQTIAASHKAGLSAIERACAVRMSFLRALRHWATFGRGWSRRVARVEAVAKDMWRKDAGINADRRKDAAAIEARHAGYRARAEVRNGGVQATGASGGAAVAAEPLADFGTYVQYGAFAVVAVVVLALVARTVIRSKHQNDRKEALEQLANG